MDNARLTSVSVVVPVLNGERTIGDTLSALLAQAQVPCEWEIIVVDNGSDDGTLDVVGRYPVRLLHAVVRGPSAARNRGLQCARAEVIAHCDADTVPSRGWLASLVAPFRDPAVLLVAGRSLSLPARTPPERYLSSAQLYDAEKNISRGVLPFAASLNMAVRRTAALAVGGWDETMLTSEDVDFSTRLIRRFRTKIHYAPDAILFHRNRDTETALQKQAWTYGEGVADTYLRYPDVVPWGIPQYLKLNWNLLKRSLGPAVLAAGRRLGLVDGDTVEYHYYHRMWTWWFWRGFFSFYRTGHRRDPA